jgi:hypothetical protein
MDHAPRKMAHDLNLNRSADAQRRVLHVLEERELEAADPSSFAAERKAETDHCPENAHEDT